MKWSKKFLDEQRGHGDEKADSLVAATFSAGKQSLLYALLKCEEKEIAAHPKSALKDFLNSTQVNPAWFNGKSLKNGQLVFQRYAAEIMTLLGAMALPYCYAASPGNKALYLSDKMRNAPGKRLFDTASFVIAVLTPGNLDTLGHGHMHINKVRLIHALSRYYLQRHPQWDMTWGYPINQEDMAGTNLAFSYVILAGLQQSGFILSQKEKEDFIFAWRYIGYLLSIHEDLLPASFSEAGQLTAVIRKRNFRKTEEGMTLTAELLNYYKKRVPGWQVELVPSQVRFYLGSEVADYVGISSDPIRDRITSSIGTFKSFSNMFTVKLSSYQAMLTQHVLLKEKNG